MSSVIQIRLIDGITYANEVKLKQQWQQRFPFETCSSGIFLHIMSERFFIRCLLKRKQKFQDSYK